MGAFNSYPAASVADDEQITALNRVAEGRTVGATLEAVRGPLGVRLGAGLLLGSRTVLSAAATASYSAPAGCRALMVQMLGGGGGGGGCDATSGGSNGAVHGSGAGYTQKLILEVAAAYDYVVGAGGAGGASGANAGSDGGDTTFTDNDGLSLTAMGGLGGAAGSRGASPVTVGEVSADTNTAGGDLNIKRTGRSGGVAYASRAVAGQDLTGNALFPGDAVSIGTATGNDTQAGSDAVNPGTGASGAAASGTGGAAAGGDGADGLIIIWEYF